VIRVLLATLLSAGFAAGASAQAEDAFEPHPGAFTGVRSFIGVWHVTETLYGGTEREYVERSVRVCESAVDDTYVSCRTRATSEHGERAYQWLLNEPEPGVIEWISVFSNYPGKGLLRGRILGDGSGIDMRAFEIGSEEIEPGSFQRIRFRSPDEFEWEVGLDNPDAAAGSGFAIERAVRVSREPSPEAITGEAQRFEVLKNNFGCRIERVTTSPRAESQFQGVSRDGEWLVYGWDDGEDADGNPVRGSERMNLVTGEIVPLPAELDNGGTFSADGSLIVGVHYVDGGRPDVFVYDIAAGTWEDVAPDTAADFLASMSDDGRRILFNSYRTGNSEVYLYDRQSSALERLTDYPGYDAHGELSPDGRRILFHRMVSEREGGGYDFDLHAHELDTGEETRLTSSPFEESYGSWAPDSRTLVFSSDADALPEEHGLYLRQPDGSITQLTGGEGWKDSYAYWTRDGRYIYFNSTRGDNADIYRIPMNGDACVRDS